MNERLRNVPLNSDQHCASVAQRSSACHRMCFSHWVTAEWLTHTHTAVIVSFVAYSALEQNLMQSTGCHSLPLTPARKGPTPAPEGPLARPLLRQGSGGQERAGGGCCFGRLICVPHAVQRTHPLPGARLLPAGSGERDGGGGGGGGGGCRQVMMAAQLPSCVGWCSVRCWWQLLLEALVWA